MNINDLLPEILEKILVKGNFSTVSRVCRTWREYTQRNRSRFNAIFFDLTKDDPEKIEKRNPDEMFLFNSPLSDKNGICRVTGTEVGSKSKYFWRTIYDDFLFNQYEKIFGKIISLKILNLVFDRVFYVKKEKCTEYLENYPQCFFLNYIKILIKCLKY